MNVSLQQGRLSREQQEEYAKEYAGLVKHIAKRMALSLPQHVDTEDLVNEGIIGFMEALQRFDQGKGAQFKTFAANRIRGAILDYLRKRDFASRGARRRLRELQKAEEALTHELGRYPTPTEVAFHMGVTLDEVARRKREAHIGYVSSLNESALRNENSETQMDMLQSDDPQVIDQAMRNEKIRALRECLEYLPEREQLLLNLYYFEGLNISEIAEILSVSEARVSQLHRRALGKLKTGIDPEAT